MANKKIIDLSTVTTPNSADLILLTRGVSNSGSVITYPNFVTSLKIGTLTNLTTTNKDNIVNALNEVDANTDALNSLYTSNYTINNVSVPTSSVTNVAYITLSRAGLWLVSFGGFWESNTSGYRKLGFSSTSTTANLNRACVIDYVPSPTGTSGNQLMTVQPLEATTYYFNVYQTSGTTLTFSGYYSAILLR